MKNNKLIFMIHKHHATHLHYDLRLEIEGTLKSWALRAITLDPHKPQLAIQVPDHPFWYRHFEGVIPEGKYGAGPVMIWDKGVYSSFLRDIDGNIISIEKSLSQGTLMIWLEGHKLKGGYLLVRVSKKQKWFMLKLEDSYIKAKIPRSWDRSIKSGKTLNQIKKSNSELD